jgi:hypothetical protein
MMIIKNAAPNIYRRNPKKNPGNIPDPTHNLETKGGVDHKTTIIIAKTKNSVSSFFIVEYIGEAAH